MPSAADSLSAIDTQIASVQAITIPADVTLGTLQADVQAAQQAIAPWHSSVRAAIATAMQDVIAFNDALNKAAATIAQLSQQQLADFIKDYQSKSVQLETTVTAACQAAGGFRTAVNNAGSALNGDQQLIAQQIQQYQSEIQSCQANLDQLNARILQIEQNFDPSGYGPHNPVIVLQEMQEQCSAAQAQLDELNAAKQKLVPLQQVAAPLTNLGGAIDTLSAGLGNLGNAVGEANNSLAAINGMVVTPAILQAELATICQVLGQASAIANEVLS